MQVYYFEGIAKNITLVMDYGLPEAMIYHKDPIDPNGCCNHDVLAYIGYEKYDPQKGYYDADRVDEKYDYFLTQKELYINEVFEYIISYVNEKFVEENALYINESSWSSSSKISPKADYKTLKERFTGSGICIGVCHTSDGLKFATGDDEPVTYHMIYSERLSRT